MRFQDSFALGLIVLAIGVLPAQAQYAEIYKIDKVTAGLEESQVLARFSEKIGVSADTLSAQKAEHNLTAGQLFMAHALAKSGGKDFGAIVSQFKSGKLWTTLVLENGVRMQPIQTDARELEKALKRESKMAKSNRRTTKDQK